MDRVSDMSSSTHTSLLLYTHTSLLLYTHTHTSLPLHTHISSTHTHPFLYTQTHTRTHSYTHAYTHLAMVRGVNNVRVILLPQRVECHEQFLHQIIHRLRQKNRAVCCVRHWLCTPTTQRYVVRSTRAELLRLDCGHSV